MTAQSVVVWFANTYRLIGLDGCSSHSGGERSLPGPRGSPHHAAGSLGDVQLLARHRSIRWGVISAASVYIRVGARGSFAVRAACSGTQPHRWHQVQRKMRG
jgi:hypothetical protein